MIHTYLRARSWQHGNIGAIRVSIQWQSEVLHVFIEEDFQISWLEHKTKDDLLI